LFRIGADGWAREIRRQNVHPGVSYILVSLNTLYATPTFAKECVIDCEGIYAVCISIPESLSSEQTAEINSLGLEVARTVHVWPTGLPCRNWDGQGQSEWLTTEYPQFGFVHDHPVHSYIVSLNDNQKLVVNAPQPGAPVFVRLDPLPVGRHRLSVVAHRESTSDVGDLSGHIELKVREPEPWTPGVSAHSGLIVSLDPYDANLDELWSNKIDVLIAGPESHTVRCVLFLENSSSEEILSEQIGGNVQLPVVPSVWRRNLGNVVESNKNQWRFLEAAKGRIEIDGGELGKHVLRFERDTLPIRWVTRNLKRRMFLRLVDDTGLEDSEPTCQFFSMAHPAQADLLHPQMS